MKNLKRRKRLNYIKRLRRLIYGIDYSNEGQAKYQILNLPHVTYYKRSYGSAMCFIELTIEGGWEFLGSSEVFDKGAQMSVVRQYYEFYRDKYLTKFCS